MRLRRRRDVIRTCAACATQWTVPAELSHERHQRRGISWREGHMFGGALTNATAGYALDLAKQRDQSADDLDDVAAAFARCPSCDSPAYEETTVRRRDT